MRPILTMIFISACSAPTPQVGDYCLAAAVCYDACEAGDASCRIDKLEQVSACDNELEAISNVVTELDCGGFWNSFVTCAAKEMCTNSIDSECDTEEQKLEECAEAACDTDDTDVEALCEELDDVW